MRLTFQTFARVVGAALVISAQALGPAAADDFPRTATGRPDLSGTYDIATLTPLVRPVELAERSAYSAEEAGELVGYWKEKFESDNVPSDPDRGAPPKGGIGFYIPELEGAAGAVGGYNAFFVDLGENTFQLDGKYRTSIVTDPSDGRFPPLSPLGEEIQARGAPFRHANTGTAWWLESGLATGPYDDIELRPLAERCILSRNRSGPPALPALYNNLKTIVQTEDHVVVLAEQMHDARIIRMNGDRPPGNVAKWMGDSVGRWEGDSLVVETSQFRESSGDLRTTAGLRVVERFSPIDSDTLRYQFTVDDPRYTAPWTGEYPWPRTDGRLYEYACHEGNYAMGNIKRGARMLEADRE
ncbi:MAG: hypothetical protein VYE73_08555 [Acidobacteriota bacterium]|nr:hypothetical protein [Acidobacteriota bacterium]